jgi:hypothetical protein
MQRRRRTPRPLFAERGWLHSACVERLCRVRTAALRLGAAEPTARPRQRPSDRFLGAPKAGPLGHVIDPARARPPGERQPEAPWPAAHRCPSFGAIHVCPGCRTSRAGGLLAPFRPRGPLACEPAPHRGRALADDRRHLGHRQPLCHRAQDHLRASAAGALSWCDPGERVRGVAMASTRVAGLVASHPYTSIRQNYRGCT